MPPLVEGHPMLGDHETFAKHLAAEYGPSPLQAVLPILAAIDQYYRSFQHSQEFPT